MLIIVGHVKYTYSDRLIGKLTEVLSVFSAIDCELLLILFSLWKESITGLLSC